MRAIVVSLLALILGSCAALPALEPPRVTVSEVEAVSIEGLELRMVVKLRVQNPNALAIDYEGIDVRLDLEGRTVANGVSAERGSIPRYGEAIVALPVTVSLLELGRQALRMFRNDAPQRMRYALEGRLVSPIFGATRFHKEGELHIPSER